MTETERLREALAPFKNCSRQNVQEPSSATIYGLYSGHPEQDVNITFADLYRLADIAAALAATPAGAERWMPIESAPHEDDVLLFGPRIGTIVGCKSPDGWMTLDGPTYRLEAFTYWQPLPAPPSPPAGEK